jgi:hypothetical protein
MRKSRFTDEQIVGFVSRPQLADVEAVDPHVTTA